MPSLRWSGGTNSPAAASLTTRPPITIVPVSLRSSPATMRKVVVLPQPEGPSSVTNSPCSIDEVDAVDRLHARRSAGRRRAG